MKLRPLDFVVAWILAACVAIAGVTFLNWSAKNSAAEELLPEKHTVFVGTSLFRYAIPNGVQPYPSDAVNLSPYLRLGLPGGREHDLVRLSRLARANGAETIVLEVNHIVSRFAHKSVRCGTSPASKWKTIREDMEGVIRGRKPLNIMTENPDNTPVELVSPTRPEKYPLQFRGPCLANEWREIAQGPMRILLVLMPRSPTARAMVGVTDTARLHERAQKFADDLGAPLLIVDPQGRWGQENFLDSAHMTTRGANHLRETFESWLEGSE